MFRPITEYVEGDACALCWGVGKTFGDVPTPKRIEVTGSGFAGVFAVCNDTFIVPQTALDACRYTLLAGAVNVDLIFSAIDTYFEMSVDGEGLAYAKSEGVCIKVSTDAGKTVSVATDEPPTPEYKIAFDQNFSPDRNTVYIDYGVVNSEKVLRLANRYHRINLLTMYEPEY